MQENGADSPNGCSIKNEWLGPRRGEWIAYLRAVHRVAEERRHDQHRFPDGMCRGIIPFGAIQDGLTREARRLALALAQPVPARRLGADGVGVTLAVVCPYCGGEHRHVFDEDALAEWDIETVLEAACGCGGYRVRVETAE